MIPVLEKRVLEHLTEPRLKPLVMTGDQKIEFLSEYCTGYQHFGANSDGPEFYAVFSAWISVTLAPTLSEAICLAAAKYEAINK